MGVGPWAPRLHVGDPGRTEVRQVVGIDPEIEVVEDEQLALVSEAQVARDPEHPVRLQGDREVPRIPGASADGPQEGDRQGDVDGEPGAIHARDLDVHQPAPGHRHGDLDGARLVPERRVQQREDQRL
jgi:hypothetical protein